MNPRVLMLGVVGCGPAGMEQPWPALDEDSRAGQDWCALAQVLVENVDPVVLESIDVEVYTDGDAFISSRPGIEEGRLRVTSYTDLLDDGTEQLWCKMKTNAAIERDLGLAVGARRDCAEAHLAMLEVAQGWHDQDVDGELPVAVTEDLDTGTGSAWVRKPVNLSEEGLQAVRLRTSMATPLVPGMSYCKLLTEDAARALGED